MRRWSACPISRKKWADACTVKIRTHANVFGFFFLQKTVEIIETVRYNMLQVKLYSDMKIMTGKDTVE